MYIRNPSKVGLFFLSVILIIAFACNLPGSSTATPAPALQTASSPGDTPAATSVQHNLIPVGLPAERSNHAGDYDSSTTAAKREAPGGDRFTFGQYERPFNANSVHVFQLAEHCKSVVGASIA